MMKHPKSSELSKNYVNVKIPKNYVKITENDVKITEKLCLN